SARRDAHHDGELDAQGLATLTACLPPDLELVIELENQGENLYVVRADQPLVATTSRGADGSLTTVVGSVQINMHMTGGLTARFRSIRETVLKQFAALAGKSGSIDRKQAGQNPMLDMLFSQADRNADSKLTLPELTAYI